MSIDIREGDILVVGSTEYPVKSCGEYVDFPSSAAFSHLANVAASTKRTPAADAGGRRGAPTENLTGLYTTPLDPADQELRERLGVESAHELLQTFLADSSGYVYLILEDIK